MNGNSHGNCSGKIGIFLIDRNKFFRQGVCAALAREMDIEVLGESDSDAEAFDQIGAVTPQVVLIDVNRPLLSGITLTRRIAQEMPGSLAVVMSPDFNDHELAQATTSGASAYLSKDIEAVELVDTIRRIAQGELLVAETLRSNPLVLGRVLRHFQDLLLKGRVVESKDGIITEREAEVLSYVACGYGNKQIAHALGISEQTIKNHMTSIMSKLGASDRTHAVVMAMQYGWISTSTRAKWSAEALPGRKWQ
ncbi:MAG: response regulator transcription factor [Dehalococcoidia bacterium]|nr:response regulator transcription factor [Dehalococcoidia bacterium]